ncbi:hypothetical protein AVEN_10475-1 [Araneus ventricosus]|uniref:Uncharacterized protein n=1 Tax=Araneus ventricosus TaxID=182803 RepID=A0A4Y2W7D4_ARAVE|nr:hypothetical protein AVEN_238183-1 [Araneus ventricosus]GBO32051.1 hypothetical protein AVEN_10475-1 [Araneus ventricosus]
MIQTKLCSYGLSFREFRPQFALFPVVGTGKNDVGRGLAKLRSNGLSFHEFRLRFALFPVVGTERINVARGFAKLRSNGLSFHEFGLRLALFPVVGTGRIDVARGFVSASAVSRVVAVNSSHIKEARRRHCIPSFELCRDICKDGTARLFEFHRPQSTNAKPERLEVSPSHTPLEES